MPVVSTLARGFATFDHWFCEVPSQTFTNRSFFHAGSSSGFVTNMIPTDAFPVHNTAETIFERLEAAGLSWKVYCDHDSIVPFTGIIHASRLAGRQDHFVTTEQFEEDAANGTLPTYSFIEPNMLHGHNDMHPACGALMPGLSVDPPSSLLGGEALLAKVYGAVRSSSSPEGSNAYNTLLLVTFDEHGGTFDHVPPPPAPPPGDGAPGELGFGFDRSGVRIPAIAISAWIPPRTVVTEEYRNTSLIRTLRERWSLGPPLTARDAVARDIAPVLTLAEPRPPEDWPDVLAGPVPAFDVAVVPLNAPLGPLAKGLFFGLLALGKELGQTVPDLSPEDDVKGAEAIAIMQAEFGHLFPRLQH
jgi:phospholipase C